jgi:hypothetical protein
MKLIKLSLFLKLCFIKHDYMICICLLSQDISTTKILQLDLFPVHCGLDMPKTIHNVQINIYIHW